MARRRIPVDASMIKPPRRGILESMAERLGVEQPGDESINAAEEPVSFAAESPENLPPESETKPEFAVSSIIGEQSSAESSASPESPASMFYVDPRIVAVKGRQALYIRLPVAMHEYLDDLAHRLSKVERNASMTNLVAQAILDKYPDCLEPRKKE